MNLKNYIILYAYCTYFGCPIMRPVVMVGLIADCVTDKLIIDFPHLFM